MVNALSAMEHAAVRCAKPRPMAGTDLVAARVLQRLTDASIYAALGRLRIGRQAYSIKVP
jgi:hypothetical protein